MCVCGAVELLGTQCENAGNVEMIESSLHWDWVSILSECVYATFHLIDLITNHDMTKKQLFFRQILADLYCAET